MCVSPSFIGKSPVALPMGPAAQWANRKVGSDLLGDTKPTGSLGQSEDFSEEILQM